MTQSHSITVESLAEKVFDIELSRSDKWEPTQARVQGQELQLVHYKGLDWELQIATFLKILYNSWKVQNVLWFFFFNLVQGQPSLKFPGSLFLDVFCPPHPAPVPGNKSACRHCGCHSATHSLIQSTKNHQAPQRLVWVPAAGYLVTCQY